MPSGWRTADGSGGFGRGTGSVFKSMELNAAHFPPTGKIRKIRLPKNIAAYVQYTIAQNKNPRITTTKVKLSAAYFKIIANRSNSMPKKNTMAQISVKPAIVNIFCSHGGLSIALTTASIV